MPMELFMTDFGCMDERHEKGEYAWANGDVYEIDFMCDKKLGKRKHTHADGERSMVYRSFSSLVIAWL
jgi:hypothetical protein